jgi:DNA-binding MarR family transcriptional regulator
MVDDVVERLGHLALGTRLKRLGERMQADTTRFIEASGLPVPASQFPLLAALDRPGGLTIGELTEAVGISQPGVTRSVTRLAGLGLVVVSHEGGDRRRRTVRLTARGAEIVETARAAVWPHVTAAVVGLVGDLDGPLLGQLGEIETRLDREPLDRRARRAAGEESR